MKCVSTAADKRDASKNNAEQVLPALSIDWLLGNIAHIEESLSASPPAQRLAPKGLDKSRLGRLL